MPIISPLAGVHRHQLPLYVEYDHGVTSKGTW